jgi:hypothetical protein
MGYAGMDYAAQQTGRGTVWLAASASLGAGAARRPVAVAWASSACILLVPTGLRQFGRANYAVRLFEVVIMPLFVSAAFLSSQLIIMVADRVPKLDVRPGCRQSTIPDCLHKEQDARKALVEEWSHFPRDDKTKCVEEAKLGGISTSYIGLQTCLQYKANLRKIPASAKPQQP